MLSTEELLWNLQERDGYKQQTETLRNKVSELSRSLADREDTASRSTAQAAQLHLCAQTLERELACSRERIAELEASLAAAERNLAATCAELSASRERAAADLEEAETRAAMLSVELADARKGAEAQAKARQKHAEELQDALSSLQATLLAKQKAHQELQEAVKRERGSWQHERVQLVSDRDGFKGQVATLRDKVSQLSQQLAVGAEDGQSKGQRVTELEQELGALRKGMAELSGRSRRELDASQQEQEQAASRAGALKDQVALLQETAKQLTQQAADAADAARTKGQLVLELEGRTATLQAALDELKHEKESWQQEQAQLMLDRGSLEAEVSALRSEVSQLTQQLVCSSEDDKAKAQLLSDLQSRTLAQEAALADAQGALKREEVVWKHERAQLVSDRDGFKGQVTTLRDKVSQLAQQLVSSSDDGSAKAKLLSDLESRTSALEAALADAQGAAKREKAAWLQERAQLTSDRDGFKGQVNTLRDKVSQLAQQLAYSSGDAKSSRITELEAALAAAKASNGSQVHNSSGSSRASCIAEAEAALTQTKKKEVELLEKLDAAESELKAKASDHKSKVASLASQRDAALSQVQALREQVAELSQSLALARTVRFPTAACSSRGGHGKTIFRFMSMFVANSTRK
jgi:chromosome segregation ATPase